MAIINIQMFYLGNFADLDINESDADAENAANLIGTYSQPPILGVAVNDVSGNNQVMDDENGATTEDFTYDTGSGSTSQLLDSTIGYNIRVLLGDGTTTDITAVAVQMQNGDVFLSDFANGGTLDNLNVQSIEILSVFNSNYAGFFADSSVDNSTIVCFTPGTLIETSIGAIPVENLQTGQLIRTLDNGYQPIRWIGQRKLNAQDFAQHPNLRPVAISKGALGNVRPIRVSPQHGFLVDRKLVRAKHLAEVWGEEVARVDHEAQSVTYLHLLFDQHQIIFAEGIATESLYPGMMALRAMDCASLAELITLFPSFVAGLKDKTIAATTYGPPARSYRTGGDVRAAKNAPFKGHIGSPSNANLSSRSNQPFQLSDI